MSGAMGFTVSSQLKSANAVSDVENHSGKANRAKLKHANPEVDTSLSHLNVEFDFLKREELLEDHYREKIDKHNKNNNSASRRWDSMDEFLATFEGKKVRHKGKETDNEQWSTSCQISYFGNVESWDALRGVLSEVGVSDDEIRKTYAEAYEGYVRAHNEHFKTLPIYHSDIHFDETTPHGHDAIVVKGHTATGKPSHSLNNALAEHYGFPTNEKGKPRTPTFSEKTDNMRRYREENDGILFKSMTDHFAELARSKGLDIDFELERTGQETSHEYHVYKAVKDRENELDDRELALKTKSKETKAKSSTLRIKELDLAKREQELAEQQAKIEEQRSAQQIASAEIEKRRLAIEQQEQEMSKHLTGQRKDAFYLTTDIYRTFEEYGVANPTERIDLELMETYRGVLLDANKKRVSVTRKEGVSRAIEILNEKRNPKPAQQIVERDDGMEL